LPPEKPFEGAGIYALYYSGDFVAYKPITDKNKNNKFDFPIYIGKAVPKGARKGGLGFNAAPGRVLFKRLQKHADSIKQTRNLKLTDFCCRYLPVDDIWIPLGESLLIEKFAPLWNSRVAGFGINDPGEGRQNQKASSWDILHPGRSYASKLRVGKTAEEILSLVAAHLKLD
jgi:hypothetical protein